MQDEADLFEELVDVLLGGWGCPLKPAYLDGPDVWRIFEVDLASAWRRHRAALAAEWQRRGGVGPCWAERQFEQAQRTGT
jgi:hypothetical protein